jgi:hypothetical protein
MWATHVFDLFRFGGLSNLPPVPLPGAECYVERTAADANRGLGMPPYFFCLL